MIGLVGVLCLTAVADATETSANLVYELLTTDGVTLSDGTVVQLPSPSLPNGTNADQQRQSLRKIAGRIPYDEFVRNSRTARFRIDLRSVKNRSGVRTGQTVDIWFVAYGTLRAINENELLDELAKLNRTKAGQNNQDRSRLLREDELAERNIIMATDEEQRERYGYFDAPVLNKVQVSGVTRSVLTQSEHSALWAIVLDDRFLSDRELPNQWRSLLRNDLGAVELGPTQPYSGLGGYVKVEELVDPKGALLVEMHLAFDEPQGWFGGANLLRTKLPLAVQENVRVFRKKLKDVAKPME